MPRFHAIGALAEKPFTAAYLFAFSLVESPDTGIDHPVQTNAGGVFSDSKAPKSYCIFPSAFALNL